MTLTPDQLKEILALHTKWLNSESGGRCADLRSANDRLGAPKETSPKDLAARFIAVTDYLRAGATIPQIGEGS